MSSLCLRPAEICLFFCEGSSSVCSSPLQLLQTDVTYVLEYFCLLLAKHSEAPSEPQDPRSVLL